LGAETGRIARPLAASLVITLMLVGAGAAEARPTHAPEHPPHDTGPRQASPCDDREGFRRLDFWLGDWIVYVGERQVGTNRIEKILAGCAIMEHWTDAGGNQGKSLFFYNPTTDRWKQVWVTQDATRPGGLKEKELVENHADAGAGWLCPTGDRGLARRRTGLGGDVRRTLCESRMRAARLRWLHPAGCALVVVGLWGARLTAQEPETYPADQDASLSGIVGFVRQANAGFALPGAEVTAAWVASDGQRRSATAEADDAGVFRLCGLPTDEVSVRIEPGPPAGYDFALDMSGQSALSEADLEPGRARHLFEKPGHARFG
jgi:hypothetical protein